MKNHIQHATILIGLAVCSAGLGTGIANESIAYTSLSAVGIGAVFMYVHGHVKSRNTLDYT